MNHAVILAGGGGTRLWPASRRSHPKQLLPLAANGETLLAATWRRIEGLFDRRWVVTAASQAEGVAQAIPELEIGRLLAEPEPRNTAAAVGLAAVYAIAGNRDSVLGILPADHAIADEGAFRDVVARALRLAAEGHIVTIGIKPTHAETGFGWIEPGPAVAYGASSVARFVEKPDRAAAESYLTRGFLWNGGMFFFRADRILDEIRRQLPALAEGLDEIGRAHAGGGAAEVIARIYPRLPSISIDHGVMEGAAGMVTVPGDFGWSDVGSWAALADLRGADAAGNVTLGRAVLLDARDNLVSVDPGGLVALVGVSGLVVVRAGDAVLVLPRERAQEVRDLVKRLEAEGLDAYL